ncbi:ArsR/SmtB family transcription factor [Subtercola sp. YIM 133946]|uniref:ArsR/SmtB family transcription factor n=1 Tax=Subtercola sp. YIM 133946 TaxID=3118909 RepID=UPI002F92BA77
MSRKNDESETGGDSGSDETGVESGADERGVDETGVESGADETGVDETGTDSGAAETGVDSGAEDGRSGRAYTGIQLDQRAVRVLAHPLRSRILGRLRVDGPLTATELAGILSTNTGATSYHLRALESVKLVTDTGEGAGKRRLWRASTDYHSWQNSDFADDEDARTALGWLQRDYVRQFQARAEQWLDVAESWPAEWVDVSGLNDTFVLVTPGQAQALKDDLDALFERYRRMGGDDPTAKRMHVHTFASPVDLQPPAEP